MQDHRLRALALLLAFCLCPAVHAQQPEIFTLAQYKAAAHTVASNVAQWRKTIDSVNVDSLPVNYATGKVYEQGKQIVGQDLNMVELWGNRAAQSDSLYDQVNFMFSMQELQMQLELLNGLVSDFSVRDAAVTAKVQNWGAAMNTIANGPLQASFTTIFNYTTRHALLADQACAK